MSCSKVSHKLRMQAGVSCKLCQTTQVLLAPNAIHPHAQVPGPATQTVHTSHNANSLFLLLLLYGIVLGDTVSTGEATNWKSHSL